MHKFKPTFLATFIAVSLSGCGEPSSTAEPANTTDNVNAEVNVESKANEVLWPYVQSEVVKDPKLEAQVKALLSKMTLEQKIAQMIQPEIKEITVADMRRYGFGSYLNGGGAFPNNNKHSTPQDWVDLAEQMYQASIDDSLDGTTIPTMWGTDAVHGHNNVIGATLFPHNIGLGAANNPELITQIAEATATEVMVTGIDWVFAPTVATVRDDRWGRTYESYSEDPAIVKSYASAIVKGLQGDANKDFLSDRRVISTVKHFIGDGGTVDGDDQGNNIDSESDLFNIHAQGYMGGLAAGAQSVMASFNSWNGKKLHGSHYLLTEVLKEKMGFDGFVVGDWNGHGQVAGCTNDSCSQSVNAGLDIFMVPTADWKPLMANTIKQVESGEIKLSRIDDAVTRILRVKVRAGLFDKPSPANRVLSNKTEHIGSKTHRDIAKQAVRESLVLLKNKNNILPLSPKQSFLIAGDGADNIGKQSGGWTITWQGTNNVNSEFPGGSSIYDGFAEQITAAGGSVQLSVTAEYDEKPDVAIVVFGEDPYAEGHGDIVNLAYQKSTKSDLALLRKLKAQGIPVVSVFLSGRPLWVNAELNASDAFVAAWLPGSEGSAIADVLLNNADETKQNDFNGKLSFSWPNNAYQHVNKGDNLVNQEQPLFAYGYGLTYSDKDTLSDELNDIYVAQVNANDAKHIFNGQTVKPWRLYLTSSEGDEHINSSSQSISGVSYRTIDKQIQEDAFKVSIGKMQAERSTGNGAGIRFTSFGNFSEDLSSIVEQKLSLHFSIKLDEPVTSAVSLSMNCERLGDPVGSCNADMDLQKHLAKLPINTWQDVSVDLACFSEKGMKFEQTITPFQLTSKGPLTVSVSNVSFKKKNNDISTHITCQ
ncbi:exo 1,3/1,4-beta-D-glucan glucohydrolase [Colwellia sp. E2M01]|uniref:glycoside hydrolase family 3 protein n=1 Tax=Colwellia sp. E2M01 TaxID=2841561 RepID=UPI001C08240A|nr:exo 1,3/1,4-beta-D-glucan glucohydrolase [Colwellia sp. E2M01]MBU2869592.1 exo 1,3/1,4-beta-D-glucan glucohydrolase [Colwellia sp. E2M01]